MFSPGFFISMALYAVVFITGFVLYPKLSKNFKWITILVLVAFFGEGSNRCGEIGMYFHNLYHPIEKILYAIIYTGLLQPGKKLKYLIWTLTITGATFDLVRLLLLTSLYHFPSLPMAFSCLLYDGMALLLFYRMLITSPLQHFGTQVYWFNTATLFFFSVTFFVYSLLDTEDRSTGIPDWQLQFVYYSNLILYIGYWVAIVLEARENIKKARLPLPTTG